MRSIVQVSSLAYLSIVQASDQMVQAAKKIIERQLPGVPIEVNQVEETAATAYGNSSGIM